MRRKKFVKTGAEVYGHPKVILSSKRHHTKENNMAVQCDIT